VAQLSVFYFICSKGIDRCRKQTRGQIIRQIREYTRTAILERKHESEILYIRGK